MKSSRSALGFLSCFVSLAACQSFAQVVNQPYRFTTLAPFSGVGRLDGVGRSARFNWPSGVAVDDSGTVYVVDTYNHAIRRISPAGAVTTLAGCAACGSGSTDGSGEAARFNTPQGIAVGPDGSLFVADTGNLTIRRVTAGGGVTTIAGQPGSRGSIDGLGGSARFEGPSNIAVDSKGSAYVSDAAYTIRKLTSTVDGWVVTTLAGTANSIGPTDGPGSEALFTSIDSMGVDADSNVYVVDGNGVRHITPDGFVTTLPRIAEHRVDRLAFDPTGQRLYFTEGTALRQATVTGTNWVVSTVADLAAYTSSIDGVAPAQQVFGPYALTVDHAGNTYVADRVNNEIRKVSSQGEVSTLAGLSSYGIADGDASSAQFNAPQGVAVDRTGTIYLADSGNHAIRRLTAIGTNVTVTTIAGKPGAPGITDGVGSDARFQTPRGIAIGPDGAVYVTEQAAAVRKITPVGTNWMVSTIANLLATGIAVDLSSNVYISVADGYNRSIRKIASDGSISTLVTFGPLAGTIFVYASPVGLAIDSSGNLYVADEGSHAVWKITADGQASIFAGPANYPYSGHVDGPGSSARFFVPQAVAVDGTGNVYVADRENKCLRKISASGVVTTVAPQPGQNLLAGGLCGLAVDAAGNLYFADVWNTVRKGSPAPDVQPRDAGFHNGHFAISLAGLTGQTAVIESSSDLKNWLPLSTNTLAAPFRFTDLETNAASQRFYRVSPW